MSPGRFAALERFANLRADDADAVAEFVECVHRHGWLSPEFDWPSWAPEGQRYLDAHESIANADLETCRRLLTLLVRRDRFCEGALEESIRAGHVGAVLRRLASIRGC